MNLLLANKQNIEGKKTNNPHWLVSGDTGNGKSVFSKWLFLYSSLLDVKVLYIDPKKKFANSLCERLMIQNIKENTHLMWHLLRRLIL